MTAPGTPGVTFRRIRSTLRDNWSQRSGSPEDASTQFLASIPPADATQPPGPTIVLLDDCRDQINFGAVALVDGLIDIIQRSLPSAAIRPIPSHWLLDTAKGAGWNTLANHGNGLRQPKATFPALADQFESVADEWLNAKGGAGAQEFLDRLQGADLVLLNGEGSIYRTNLSAIRELFIAWLAKERLGIPTVFLNGMIHLTDVTPVLPAMVRKALSALDAVAVREPFSLRNLSHYAPAVDARLFPDSAFAIAADAADESAAVAAIRDQTGGRPYFCFDPGAMPMDHRLPRRSAMYELIVRLKSVVPEAVLVSSSPTDTYIEKIARETESIYVDAIDDYRAYMSLTAEAQFVVTGRYHNPILAAITGCPSITLASANHKVHGACEMLEGLVGEPYDGTYIRPVLDDIERRARSYVEHREGLKARLLEVCDRRRSEAFDLGRLVADTVRR